MGDMYGLEMIGELNKKELVEELKNLREEIEVMKRVLENVEMVEMRMSDEILWCVRRKDGWRVSRMGKR